MFEGAADCPGGQVDPVSKWADQLQIVALASYFQIPVRIHYLDQSPGNQSPGGAGRPYVQLSKLLRFQIVPGNAKKSSWRLPQTPTAKRFEGGWGGPEGGFRVADTN